MLHFLRQANGRWQTRQIFSGRSALATRLLGKGMVSRDVACESARLNVFYIRAAMPADRRRLAALTLTLTPTFRVELVDRRVEAIE